MAPKRNTAPTMKDVAAEAGVALGTVSKVYNNLPVRDEYREKVLAAAHKLGYSVNRYARGFKTNRTNTVALIWPTLRNPFFAYLSDAMIGELTRRDYRAIVSITNYDGQAEQRCLDMVRQNKVDGVIALTYNPIWRLPLICLLSVLTGILEPVCPVSLLITLAAGSWPPKNCWNWAVKSCSFCVWVQLLPASPTNARPALRQPAGNGASLSILSPYKMRRGSRLSTLFWTLTCTAAFSTTMVSSATRTVSAMRSRKGCGSEESSSLPTSK